jgi:hypothetical protein
MLKDSMANVISDKPKWLIPSDAPHTLFLDGIDYDSLILNSIWNSLPYICILYNIYKLVRWLTQLARVASCLPLLSYLKFLKVHAYMHLYYLTYGCCIFSHHVPCTGSTNLLLQLVRYNLLLYAHHPLWSSSPSRNLTRINFFHSFLLIIVVAVS